MARFDIDHELVRGLAKLLDETGLTELEYAKGREKIRVSRSAAASPRAAVSGAAEAAAPVVSDNTTAVMAPMVGTVYLSPEPQSPPFVSPGDTVSEGQTLLLIEAMKTFNPVRAPRAGRIVRILVVDGTPVEYDEKLMIVE